MNQKFLKNKAFYEMEFDTVFFSVLFQNGVEYHSTCNRVRYYTPWKHFVQGVVERLPNSYILVGGGILLGIGGNYFIESSIKTYQTGKRELLKTETEAYNRDIKKFKAASTAETVAQEILNTEMAQSEARIRKANAEISESEARIKKANAESAELDNVIKKVEAELTQLELMKKRDEVINRNIRKHF